MCVSNEDGRLKLSESISYAGDLPGRVVVENVHRRETILQWLGRDGQVQVCDLADHFDVSGMTIRRDLEYLAGKGKLVRTYGGAVPVAGLTRELPYAAKAVEHAVEKERIARKALELVHDGDMVLLADATKFGLRSLFQVCPLSSLSHIISDGSLPAEVARAIRKGGVELDLV